MNNIVKKFKLISLGSCLSLVLAASVISTASYANTDDDIRAAQVAKISLKQAIDTASKQAKGALVDVEFDDDDSDSLSGGGVYELAFKDGTTEYEIKVDAVTGQVVDLDTSSLDSDDKEDYAVQRRAKISVKGIIDSVDNKDGNRILEIEFEDDGDDSNHPQYYEVDLLRGNQIYEIKIDADTGREFARKIKD